MKILARTSRRLMATLLPLLFGSVWSDPPRKPRLRYACMTITDEWSSNEVRDAGYSTKTQERVPTHANYQILG
jgi:hypothetical protein